MTQPYGHDNYGQQPYTQPGGYGYPPGPPPPPYRKKSSAPLVLLIIGVAVVVLFGGCAALVAVVGSSPSSAPTHRGAEAADAPTAVKTAGKKKRETQDTAGIGAKVRDGKFEFTITKLGRQSQVGDSFLGKQAQGEFLLVHVTVENIGDEAQSFLGNVQKLYDAKGREYEASAEAALYLKDSKSLYEQINPGNKVDGIVLFDIPKNVEPAEIELHDSMFSDGVRVSLR
ncbi:MAG: DUF4352 domain-containing protein [Nonomuraea sp.]|nr:DUF4352 domain-containing protein [Nonomuraea sp.]